MSTNTAAEIVNKLGGAANIESLSHCATRLRFQLRDASAVAQSDLESVSGVLGAVPQAGERYQVVIDALPTSNVFQRGHAIRVDIASSNFPKFDCNPNSGGAEGFAGPVKVARNTVYMDESGPSHIVLPIVPSGSAPR